MRSKRVFAVLFFLCALPAFGQVAPTLKVSGIPLGVGGGLSDYSLDYGPGRRMEGFSAWADYSIFHGLGIEAEGTTIFLNKPSSLTRMRQDSLKGGLIYRARSYWKIRPYAKALMGIGSIDFPSNNPLYTHDTFTVEALGGGLEYPVWHTLYLRADYEYQIWNQYHGPYSLTPNGFTLGATYYLRGIHGHS